jgi:hypothetical protein
VTCHRGGAGLGPDIAAAALDLSGGGIRLLLTLPVDAGLRVAVGLRPAGDRPPTVRGGVVVWSVPAGDGACCAGVAFDDPLTHAELDSLASRGG